MITYVVFIYRWHNKAVNKKKSVSCPAGGRNYGQLGGRKFFFFVGEYCQFFEKEYFFCKNEKKSP